MLFDQLHGPAPITMEALQRKAAELSGEKQLVGASTQKLTDDTSGALYLYYSLTLAKTYYLYSIDPTGETLIKLHTEGYPPPNQGDRPLKSWSTRADSAVDAVVHLVKSILGTDDLDIALDHYEFEECVGGQDFLKRRNHFTSNYGGIETGSRREANGDTSGYVLFHVTGMVIEFTDNVKTGATKLTPGQDNQRPF